MSHASELARVHEDVRAARAHNAVLSDTVTLLHDALLGGPGQSSSLVADGAGFAAQASGAQAANFLRFCFIAPPPQRHFIPSLSLPPPPSLISAAVALHRPGRGAGRG